MTFESKTVDRNCQLLSICALFDNNFVSITGIANGGLDRLAFGDMIYGAVRVGPKRVDERR
jgi:hypothetical protein